MNKIIHAKKDKEISDNFISHKQFVMQCLSRVIRTNGFVVSHEEREDLIQSGLVELVKIHRKFDPNLNIPFHGYAHTRICCSFIDEFRKKSTIPRRQQQFYSKYIEYKEACAASGRTCCIVDAAKALGIDVDKLSAMLVNWESRYSISISNEMDNDPSFLDNSGNPESIMEEIDKGNLISNAIETLSDREKTVLTMYFDHDISLNDIAKNLDVTTSRVSQIKNEAIEKIKNQIL